MAGSSALQCRPGRCPEIPEFPEILKVVLKCPEIHFMS